MFLFLFFFFFWFSLFNEFQRRITLFAFFIMNKKKQKKEKDNMNMTLEIDKDHKHDVFWNFNEMNESKRNTNKLSQSSSRSLLNLNELKNKNANKVFFEENQTKIPTILHQMWLDPKSAGCTESPEKYQKKQYPQSFKDKNPSWIYIFWNLEKVKNLFQQDSTLQKYYTYFLSLTPVIKQCDFSRWAILYKYGGIYVDLDFICYKPLDNLIKSRKLLFCRHHSVFAREKNRSISNAMLGSIKKHLICLFMMDEMKKKVPHPQADIFSTKLLNAYLIVRHTGPLGLTNYFLKWQKLTKQTDKELFVPSRYIFDCPPILAHLRYFFNVKKFLIQFSNPKEMYMNTFWIEGENWKP